MSDEQIGYIFGWIGGILAWMNQGQQRIAEEEAAALQPPSEGAP